MFDLQVMVELRGLVGLQRGGLLLMNQVGDTLLRLLRRPKIDDGLRRAAAGDEIDQFVVGKNHRTGSGSVTDSSDSHCTARPVCGAAGRAGRRAFAARRAPAGWLPDGDSVARDAAAGLGRLVAQRFLKAL